MRSESWAVKNAGALQSDLCSFGLADSVSSHPSNSTDRRGPSVLPRVLTCGEDTLAPSMPPRPQQASGLREWCRPNGNIWRAHLLSPETIKRREKTMTSNVCIKPTAAAIPGVWRLSGSRRDARRKLERIWALDKPSFQPQPRPCYQKALLVWLARRQAVGQRAIFTADLCAEWNVGTEFLWRILAGLASAGLLHVRKGALELSIP